MKREIQLQRKKERGRITQGERREGGESVCNREMGKRERERKLAERWRGWAFELRKSN